MCLECLKDKKLLAIWFSGLFGADAIGHLIMLILGVELTVPKLGITVNTTWNFASFLISGFISVVLCWWSCKQTVKKPRRAKR